MLSGGLETMTRLWLYLIVIACVITGVFILLLFWISRNGRTKKTTPQPTTTQITPTIPLSRISTGDESYTLTTNIANQMKIISPKLGISFLYLEIKGVPKVVTKEEGDKVYIYADYHYSGFDYHKESYVEVFYKDPHDSLETAIKKTILTGYSQNDCFVKKTTPYRKHTSTYETAIITFPYDQTAAGINHEYVAASEKCPPIYTPTNYVAYFAMDKNHPGKFVFFNIGQSTVLAEPGEIKPPYKAGRSWDETLQFLP